MIRIDYEKCIGCGICFKKCFSGAVIINEKKPVIGDACIYCGNCVDACPVDAISIDKEKPDRLKDIFQYSGIWVMVENNNIQNIPRKVTYELLSKARELADSLNEEVSAVYLGYDIPETCFDNFREVGCNRLYLIQDKELRDYHTETYTEIVANLIRQYRPSTVLFPGTENGRDLAPRLSAKLEVGLTADCTDLEINENRELVQIRPTYGGNVIASIISPYSRPQMASVRSNVFEVVKSRKVNMDIINVPFLLKQERRTAEKLKVVLKDNNFADVESADIVFVGGYGVGKEGFEQISKLAKRMNVAVGATRKVVDEGWAPFEIQVGQTGKMIAPKLCVTFGVSGALQFMIGIRNAKKIISVNNDPAASILGTSDMAIFADAKQLLNSLIQNIENEKAR